MDYVVVPIYVVVVMILFVVGSGWIIDVEHKRKIQDTRYQPGTSYLLPGYAANVPLHNVR